MLLSTIVQRSMLSLPMRSTDSDGSLKSYVDNFLKKK